MRGVLLCFVALVLAAGCDSRAKAFESGAHRPKSKELESCSASVDCAENLRCFDTVPPHRALARR